MPRPIFDIHRGTFLCHAHLGGSVNAPLYAECPIPHRNPDRAWECPIREHDFDRAGTKLTWSTCRPEFCQQGIVGRKRPIAAEPVRFWLKAEPGRPLRLGVA